MKGKPFFSCTGSLYFFLPPPPPLSPKECFDINSHIGVAIPLGEGKEADPEPTSVFYLLNSKIMNIQKDALTHTHKHLQTLTNTHTHVHIHIANNLKWAFIPCACMYSAYGLPF